MEDTNPDYIENIAAQVALAHQYNIEVGGSVTKHIVFVTLSIA